MIVTVAYICSVADVLKFIMPRARLLNQEEQA